MHRRSAVPSAATDRRDTSGSGIASVPPPLARDWPLRLRPRLRGGCRARASGARLLGRSRSRGDSEETEGERGGIAGSMKKGTSCERKPAWMTSGKAGAEGGGPAGGRRAGAGWVPARRARPRSGFQPLPGPGAPSAPRGPPPVALSRVPSAPRSPRGRQGAPDPPASSSRGWKMTVWPLLCNLWPLADVAGGIRPHGHWVTGCCPRELSATG